MPQNPQDQTQTVEITNFSGSLTRENLGDMNSGLAKYNTSFGYDPFSKPKQLTWLSVPSNLSTIVTSGLALAGVSAVYGSNLYTYVITSTGHLFRLLGDGSGGSDIRTLSTGSPTFTYGADIIFFGLNTLFISHDLGVTKIVLDTNGGFSSEAQIGTWDSTHFTAITTQRRMVQAFGALYVINSDSSVTYANNIAEITTAGTVNNYAKLSPSLPPGTFIRDLDLSPDFTYMIVSASQTPSELIAPVNDTGNESSTTSAIYLWNGSTALSGAADAGITTGMNLPDFSITSTQSLPNARYSFMYDAFGSSVFDGSQKIMTMKNQKSPMPAATIANGNFLTWMCTDASYNLDTAASSIYASLYYYGSLDAQSPTGLWRVLRKGTATGSGTVYQVPYQQLVTNSYISVDTNDTITQESVGRHLYSCTDYTGSGGSTLAKFYGFVVSPAGKFGTDNGPQLGVYETQTQLFSKKITVKQARVYMEPAVSGNGFQLDLIGSDGKVITNGTSTFTYALGTDPTFNQGALERYDFNPAMKDTYALGVRITNTGTTNMTINKVEIDYIQSGK